MKKGQHILSVCIPTYNRAKDLEYNLSLLESYINESELSDKVCLVISNNCSTDETDVVIRHFVDSGKIYIQYYNQERNIGAGPNQVYTVEKASTPWVMLLGDDDYLEPWYIKECVKQIEENPKLGVIIANYTDYYPSTGKYGHLREEDCETEYYQAGFEACAKNAWRAHQLSGLCFIRNGVIDAFHKNKMDNLYPQIFFVTYNALRYDVMHFGSSGLRVSVLSQDKKDWRYGQDFLMNDILQNFRYLGLPIRKRAILEAEFNGHQKRYLWASKEHVNEVIDNILDAPNLSLLGKYYYAEQLWIDNIYSGKKHKQLIRIAGQIIRMKRNLLHR